MLLDRDPDLLRAVERRLSAAGHRAKCIPADVTNRTELDAGLTQILRDEGRIDGLVNNAAINPQVTADGSTTSGRFEDLPLSQWDSELAVSLTGAFLCCQVFGGAMARAGNGAIVNIASDLSLISPDQRLYRDSRSEVQSSFKPASYSVAKSGLIGLTRYLSTYWAAQGVRVNALSPGGVRRDQDAGFLERIATRIPLGRLAERNEYQCALAFLLSDAYSYITGSNLVADGGRSVW